jgi:FAD/FMN-containing dehydrogenase
MAELRHLGGALGRDGAGHGALGRVDGDFLAFGVGMVMNEQMAAKVRHDAAALMEAMAPYGHGRAYSNFAENPTDPASFYPDEVYTRLREVRARVDPDGLMRANHVIGG